MTNKPLPLFVVSNYDYNLKKCEELGIERWKGSDGRIYSAWEVSPEHLCNFLNKLHKEGRLTNRHEGRHSYDDWSYFDPYEET
jgi:DNA-binding PadR family transcriptional regulator